VRIRSLSPLLAVFITVLPASPQELHWYRGNTHTHTINSDGDTSPDAVVRWYKEHYYQFIFVTDHEYITDAAPLNAIYAASERFLLLPGQEITQVGRGPKTVICPHQCLVRFKGDLACRDEKVHGFGMWGLCASVGATSRDISD
jgi:hypothetical protein